MGENLYNIAGDMMKLNAFEIETDEDEAAFDALLDEIQDRFETKAENILKFRAGLLGTAAEWKAEGDRIVQAARRRERKAERLKKYLERSLFALGGQAGDKYEAGTFTLRLQKNPPSLIVDDADKIPAEFREPQPDKILTADVKKAISEGQKVPGAHTEVVISMRIV